MLLVKISIGLKRSALFVMCVINVRQNFGRTDFARQVKHVAITGLVRYDVNRDSRFSLETSNAALNLTRITLNNCNEITL